MARTQCSIYQLVFYIALFPGPACLSLAVQHSHRILYCKQQTRRAWERGYILHTAALNTDPLSLRKWSLTPWKPSIYNWTSHK